MNEFINAVKDNDIDLVMELIDSGVDPSKLNNEAIRWASLYGHYILVRELLKDDRVDPTAVNNFAIRWASSNGHYKVVRELLKDDRIDLVVDNNYAIRWASNNSHIEIVELLLKDIRVLRMLNEEQVKMYSIINRALKDKFRVETDEELKDLIHVI